MIKQAGCFLAAIAVLVSTSLAAGNAVLAAAPANLAPATNLANGRASLLYGRESAGKFHQNILHFKLRADAGITLAHGTFTGGDRAETKRLNAILASAHLVSADKLVHPKTSVIGQRVSAAVKDYYKVTFAGNVDVVSIADQLQSLTKIVVSAYPEAVAAAAPSAPSYTSLQNYLTKAPNGIDTTSGKIYKGANGSAATIVDIEYSWNTAHADLTKAAAAVYPFGTPVDPFSDNNHGTSVLGELVGDDNTFGVTGGAPGAKLALINAESQEYGYDPADALLEAADLTKPGDVVLVEQQAWGPTATGNDFLPIEWIPEVYDAIKSLTDSGVTVVEPAGNGAQSLDNPELGGSFPMGKVSSGAIIVGAGENCAGAPANASWLYFSNYGSRVNLQGPGDCVVTTGSGDLYSQSGPNYLYTRSFNGTSSAAPVIAAAAADLSSAYQTLNGGATLSTAYLASILRSSGTAQVNGQALASANQIGPRPNLARALQAADTVAPSSVTVKATATADHHVSVQWTPAKDNVQVAGYQLYRNGVFYRTFTGTTFTNSNVVKGKSYSYRIVAVDEAGHRSTISNAVSVKVR